MMLDGYNFRRSFEIDGSVDGQQTDYQKHLNVIYDDTSVSPKQVDTSAALFGWGIHHGNQPKIFYMAGLLWFFYLEDTDNFCYVVSVDGITWSYPVELDSGITISNASTVSLYFDDTYLYYVEASTTNGDDVYMRRGTPQSDGTMSWSAARQLVQTIALGKVATYPMIWADSNGYVWIGYIHHDYGLTTNAEEIVTKSSTNDGTWATAAGFPHTLQSAFTYPTSPKVVGCSLGGGEVLVVYSTDDYTEGQRSKLWDGAAWEAEEIAIGGTILAAYPSLIADGGNAHLITAVSPDEWTYAKYTGGVGWGPPEVIGTYDGGMGGLCITDTDCLIAAWIDHDADEYINYNIMTNGSWGAEDVLVDESVDKLSDYRSLTVMPASGGKFKGAVGYISKTSTPWNVKIKSIYQTTGNTVVLGNKVLSSFNDIRFTTDDGETEVDYCAVKIVSSEYAKVWIEFDTIVISPGSSTFYIYYNNNAASNGSNGANTFIDYDDFERGNDGDEIGGDWTESAGTVEISTGQAYYGTRSMKLVGDAARSRASIPRIANSNIAIIFNIYKEDGTTFNFNHGDGTTRIEGQLQSDEDIVVYDGVAYVDLGHDVKIDEWVLLKFCNFDWVAKTMDVYLNDIKIGSAVDISWANAGDTDEVSVCGGTAGNESWLDNYIVVNFTINEPPWGDWGEEEYLVPPRAQMGVINFDSVAVI